MDPRSILDNGAGQQPPPADSLQRGWPGTSTPDTPAVQGDVRFPDEDGGKSLAEMAQRDLTATLQLLAERAQYITGATGAAIALRDCEEMVCRARAGTSAPEVGAQLQVNSGLSGESVRTRQTLRCDDAATDPRVNRESCQALGIASVVVMPLVRGNDVIGVFELFSDQANVFEARDITALERMGVMVFTALEHAIAAQGLTNEAERGVPAGRPAMQATAANSDPPASMTMPEMVLPADIELANVVEARAMAELPKAASGISFHRRVPAPATSALAGAPMAPASWQEESDDILGDFEQVEDPGTPAVNHAAVAESAAPVESAHIEDMTPSEMAAFIARRVDGIESSESETAETGPAVGFTTVDETPSAPASSLSPVAGLRKCDSCGFPVSEGRQLCLDCERKNQGAGPSNVPGVADRTLAPSMGAQGARPQATEARSLDDGPRFMGQDQEESSWLASHKYMVGAITIAAAGILVLLLVR